MRQLPGRRAALGLALLLSACSGEPTSGGDAFDGMAAVADAGSLQPPDGESSDGPDASTIGGSIDGSLDRSIDGSSGPSDAGWSGEADNGGPAEPVWIDRPDLSALGWNDLACDHPEYWPNQLASAERPLVVHFSMASHAGVAAEALAFLEAGWAIETEELGFSPPLDDAGTCGPDGRFDVFLWEGQDYAWVEALEGSPSSSHDDWTTYMVVDPWGTYGGDVLGPTLVHELCHACQAADDWWDIELAYEATSTFVEGLLFPDDHAWSFVLADFQAYADWSLTRNDDYETWYMYGAALYLFWLDEAVFDDDPAWIGALWAGMRNPPGDNEPDFEDSLRSLLMAHAGLSFVETVVQFSAWRWAPPSPFDGHSIPLAADVPAKQTTVVLDPAPMLLGSVYVRVKGAPGESISVGVDGDSAVAWAVRTTGADSVDPTLSAVTLDDTGELVLAVTALPLVPEGDDPDDRSDDRYGVSLLLGYSGGE